MLTDSVIQANLNTVFAPRISSQINNLTPTLAAMPKSMEFAGQKVITWNIQTSLNPGGGSYASGADITLAGNEYAVEVPAALGWKYVQVPFQVAASTIAQTPGNGPEAYSQLLVKQIDDAGTALAKKLGSFVFTDGTGNSGLDPAGFLAALGSVSGSYAGVSRATYTVWQPYLNANGGTGRPLTKTLLDTGETNIYTKSGMSFDYIVTTPSILQTYESLFTNATVPIVRTESDQSKYGMGATELYYKGKPVYRDINCPAGYLFMVSRSSWNMQMLPPVSSQGGIQLLQGNKALTNQTGDLGIQVGIELLGKTGDNYKGFLKVYYNNQCTNPNYNACFADLQ